MKAHVLELVLFIMQKFLTKIIQADKKKKNNSMAPFDHNIEQYIYENSFIYLLTKFDALGYASNKLQRERT